MFFLPSFTGFFAAFDLVSPSLMELVSVLPSFTGFYRLLLGFTEFLSISPRFTGFFGFLPEFHWVLLGFHWVFTEI